MGATDSADLGERPFRLLQLVIDWLKFAEAKRVGMAGLASGAIGFLVVFLGTTAGSAMRPGPAVLMIVGGFALLLSFVVSSTLFPPQASMERLIAGCPDQS